jgi:protein involved in polysaccharide export with SLBB domain
MFRFMMDHVSRHAATPVLAWLAVFLIVSAFVTPVALATGDEGRDFPPLVDPARRVPVERGVTPGETPAAPETLRTPPAGVGTAPTEPEAYLLGVGDELQISVLSSPELSGPVKVRPDGAITTPGAGTVHALGRTPEDVGREIEEKLGAILRYARVDVVVTNFGLQRVFIMGEVDQPGDRPFYKGMSALQAVAVAGGIKPTGKSASVLVLRRTGTDTAEVRRLDLGSALRGEAGADFVLHPFDIVYVPRTFIAKVDTVIEQYVREAIVPFSLYYEGWRAFQLASGNVKWIGNP